MVVTCRLGWRRLGTCRWRWGNGRQFTHLLFTGGGAETLRDDLLRQYPHGVVLPEPITANAIGLARYGVRVFKS